MDWVVTHATDMLAAGFAVLAVMHLAGIQLASKAAGAYPQGFRKVTGALYGLAAVLLVFGPTRLAGVAVAAFALFLSATTLLHRRQYGYAVPVIVTLFAMIPVSLASTV